MKRLLLGLTAAVSMIAIAPAAHANPLAPGASNVSFTPFTGALAMTQGTQLANAVLNSQDEVNPSFNANFRTAVYRNTLGTLDFYYQLALNSISPSDEVVGLSAFNFAGYSVEAFFVGGTADADGAGTVFTAPNNPNPDGQNPGFTSTAARNGAGGTVFANFGGNGLEAAGETSATYIFRTNAVSFAQPANFTATGGSVARINGFAPTGPAVPEPATWGMMIVGFGVVGAALRRRRTPALAKA